MKNGKAIFLSAAVILGAAGMIFGNHVLASNALADDTQEPAIVMPEGDPVSTTQLSDVGMYGNSDGAIYLAMSNSSADVQKQEETRTANAANQSSDVAGRKATTVVSGSAEDPFKEGTPLENELSSDKAQEIATAAIVEKYALTQKTLDKFIITTKYYEVTPGAPGKHVWWVNLYPANNDDFSEIGCYWTYLDAETGEILQLNSAANGKG